MSNDDLKRKLRRIVAAPVPSNPRVPAVVINAECAEDEEIEWIWTETVEGRFVSGYRVVPKLGKSVLT